MFANIFRGLGIVSVCVGLSSCTTQEKVEAVGEALKGSAALRAKVIEKCINNERQWNPDSQEGLATIVTTADSRNKRLICERLYNGIASGRLTAKDIRSFNDETLTPNAIRVLRGK
ncbi:hypothetical protein KX729_19110 [Rhizobium sp. XQZ8]|nr:hypothetical protein [Rhizobium populisoli]